MRTCFVDGPPSRLRKVDRTHLRLRFGLLHYLDDYSMRIRIRTASSDPSDAHQSAFGVLEVPNHKTIG